MASMRAPIAVPEPLAAHYRDGGAAEQAWAAGLPALAEEFLDRWQLRPQGPPAHGAVSLVLPVLRIDGTAAVLKLQPADDETCGEPLALRAWGGVDAVRLLDHDPGTGTMLLERLDAARSLLTVPDDLAALATLSELLARLVAHPAPEGLRRLSEVMAAILEGVPQALARLADAEERRLLANCTAAVREVAAEPGDRLLHWDLHYANVLASQPASGRPPWLAIDPKPLAGDPGFELLPALRNRWDDVAAVGDVPRAVRRRFDLMTETLGLDRQRARAWTLGRILQNALWGVEGGDLLLQPEQAAIARTLLATGVR